MYKQLKIPNLDPFVYQNGEALTSWLGYCLAYVQTAFGSGWAGADAWQGWAMTKKKHKDRNFPKNVYFPIWFDGWWDGYRYGHVAIAHYDGSSLKIWSSPITNKPYADIWTSIEQVEQNYGMTFVGWSEDIGGTTVISKGDSGMIIQNAENWYGRCNKTHLQIRGRELARSTFAAYVGRDFLHFVEDCSDDPEANRVQEWQTVGKLAVQDKWQQQIYDLQAALKKAPSSAEIDKAKKQAADLQKQMAEAEKRAAAAEKKAQDMNVERIEVEKVGNAFVLWLGGILSKLTGGK